MNYKIIETIGTGGYGVVSSAVFNDELVAIKKYSNKGKIKGLQPEIIREIAILLFIKHDNIISPKFIEIADGVILGMELCGTNLHKFTINTSFMDRINCSQTIIIQIAQGLNHIHKSCICHRDIKPDNILIKQESNNLIVKICDFGLSKLGDNYGPYKGTGNIGTLNYRSPESFGENPLYDTSVDMWAFGCTIFELISKRRLFNGKTEKDVLNSIEHIIPNKSLDPNIPNLCPHNLKCESSVRKIETMTLLIKSMVRRNDRIKARSVLKMFDVSSPRKSKFPFSMRLFIGSFDKSRNKQLEIIINTQDVMNIPLYIELFDATLNKIYSLGKFELFKDINIISATCYILSSKFLDISPVTSKRFQSMASETDFNIWELRVLEFLEFKIARKTITKISLMKNYSKICNKTYTQIISS